jgi:serine/threonine protein kinase
MNFAPGTRIGPYEVVSMLGAGGMGEVYRARDSRLDRTVAIKFSRADDDEDIQGSVLFEREGRAIAALNHPRICSVYDVGRVAARNYLVMEYLDGETLEQRLRHGPLPLSELFTIAIGVAEALVAAHRAGIVHRDLKPANVMLTPNGLKLLDFGIAKHTVVGLLANEQDTDATVAAPATVTGRLVGTIPYMAPEQLDGAPTDGRTDVFAFGAMLFEMVTGKRAFGGASAASQMAAILADTRPRPPSELRPDIPRALDRIICTCLARDPDDRWQHAGDLLRQLRWSAEDERDGQAPSANRRRSWSIHGYWAAALGMVGIALSLVWWSGRHTGPPPNVPPVIVLLDSPLPGRVYDPRTVAEGGTNADDVTDALRALPVAIRKENTSAVWHREQQVLLENPDLIVSHLSCFLDERVAAGDPAILQHLADVAEYRLLLFFAYVAARNPRTHFIAYSRSQFTRKGGDAVWLTDQEAHLPILRGRLHPLTVPGKERATFREPSTAELLRARVRQILNLPKTAQSSDSSLNSFVMASLQGVLASHTDGVLDLFDHRTSGRWPFEGLPSSLLHQSGRLNE